MNLSIKAKQFIEDNIQLLEENNYDEFYHRLRNKYAMPGFGLRNNLNIDGERFVAEVFQVIRSANIDLLPYFDFIPIYYYMNDTDLVSVNVPEHIRVIDEFAFAKCVNLEYVYIPSNVKAIRSKAFFSCDNLKVIEVDSIEDFTSIIFSDSSNPLNSTFACPILKIKGQPSGKLVLSNNTQLRIIPCAHTDYNELTFDVKIIPSAYCYNCQLRSVSFSTQLERVKNEAFLDCKSLTDISYEGTTEEWNNVVMSPSSFRNVPAKTITCSDGTTKLRH